MSDHEKFRDDMEAAGFEVEEYEGRYFWKGPAVYSGDPEAVMAATSVVCQKDQMGKEYVIYPRARE